VKETELQRESHLSSVLDDVAMSSVSQAIVCNCQLRPSCTSLETQLQERFGKVDDDSCSCDNCFYF
jgi:hypothetical protein